jgi:hypothetical protein
MCVENNYSNGGHKGGSSTRWGGSLLCRSKSNVGMKFLPRYGQSKSAARVAMEVASDIGAWGRCHPRPSFFGGTDQIPTKKIDKSTSTINKFDLGHKNHKKTEFLCQPNLSTNLQKKSTDQQTNLVFWDTDLKFVNMSTNFKSVDLSILPAIL